MPKRSVVSASRLRLAAPEDTLAALTAALAGGDPMAPLPDDPAESVRIRAMLRPDEPLENPETAVIVATSGSTGDPKGVLLSRSAIIAAAEASHDRLGGPGTWLLALSPHYVAGLMVLARSIVTGRAPITVGSDLGGLSTAIAGSGPHYLSIVPTQLARALRDPATTQALASLDAVLLGGSAAPPDLRQSARTAGIPIVTTYGMSETCGGCVYDGIPLPGTEVDLEPSTNRIRISGPMIFSGYRLRPDLTAEVLHEGTVLTADRGHWEQGPVQPHRLRVLGRVDDVVISGGVNVDLAAVQRTANAWPDRKSSEIVIIGVQDPEWGTRVIAVTDGSADVAAFQDHLRSRLPAVAVPKRLHHVDELPRTSGGKIDRQKLITQFSEQETKDSL